MFYFMFRKVAGRPIKVIKVIKPQLLTDMRLRPLYCCGQYYWLQSVCVGVCMMMMMIMMMMTMMIMMMMMMTMMMMTLCL